MRGEGVSRPLWSRRAGQQVWRGGRVLPSGEEYEQQGSRCEERGRGREGEGERGQPSCYLGRVLGWHKLLPRRCMWMLT